MGISDGRHSDLRIGRNNFELQLATKAPSVSARKTSAVQNA